MKTLGPECLRFYVGQPRAYLSTDRGKIRLCFNICEPRTRRDGSPVYIEAYIYNYRDSWHAGLCAGSYGAATDARDYNFRDEIAGSPWREKYDIGTRVKRPGFEVYPTRTLPREVIALE